MRSLQCLGLGCFCRLLILPTNQLWTIYPIIGIIEWTRSTRVVGEKPLFWIGSAKSDLLEFPEAVKDEIGVALSVAQFGGKHPKAKPWKGEGSGVLEIVEDHRGDTYRAVYTVRFERAAYVLHAFQKKSPKGIKTSQTDVEMVSRRLKAASEDYEARHGKRKK
jgi:phage-related protein